MKALEFESTISQSGAIALPPEIAAAIPAGQPLRIVVMWDPDSDSAWGLTARRAFEAAYAPEDDVYEQLVHDAPTR